MKRPHLLSTLVLSAALGLAPAALAQPSMASVREAEEKYLLERREVSLEEAMRLAALRNQDIKAAKARADEARARSGMVLAAVLPELAVSATYVHTSVPIVFNQSQFSSGIIASQTGLLQALPGVYPTVGAPTPGAIEGFERGAREALGEQPDIIIQDRNSLFGSGTLTQTLFTPKLLLIPSAFEFQEAARLGSLEAREQVLVGVARLYLALEGLEQLAQAARDAEAVALKREQEAKSRVAAGLATEVDVLRATSQVAEARAQLVKLLGARIGALAMLEAVAGDKVRPVAGGRTALQVGPSSEEEQPWEQGFGLKSAQQALQGQERFNLYDRFSWMPTLFAQGKATYNSNRGFAGQNWIFDGIVGAQWTLFDRGVRYVEMRENDAKTATQRATLEASRARARASWIAARENLEVSRVALQQAEASAAVAERAQKQVGTLYANGLVTALDAQDIDNKRFLAVSAAAQARAEVELKKVELAAAEGRLARLVGLE